MMTVEHILDDKGRHVWSVAPRDSVHSAIRLLSAHNVGAVLVCEGGRIVGILSERDCVRRVMLHERAAKDTLVSSVMTSPVMSVRATDTLEHCLKLMTDHRVRHLPVMEHGHLLGILSVGDIVKARLDVQEHMIEDLERYIAGSPASMHPPAE